VALLFLFLRLYLKWQFGKRIGWDDFLLVFSWILLSVYAVCITTASKYGLGRHMVDIPKANLPSVLKYMTIGEFFAVIALSISKTSFAVTLLRLVGRTWQIYFIWFVIVSLNIAMWLDAIILFASCTPVERKWNKDVSGVCWNRFIVVGFGIFSGAYSGAMDILLAILPVTLMWNLQLERKKKIGVCVSMSLGVFAGIAAAIKTSNISIKPRKDITFDTAGLFIWAASEAAVTVVATSIPYLR
ncbi:hypothetical protein K469DRAFT_541752, partial [Zopfia rhizophila CBS 207.26]